MKPLIIFFWCILITINIMAKEPLISRFEKSPLIYDCGCDYLVYELSLKAVVYKTRISSSQNICIRNKYSQVSTHTPHPYIMGYETNQDCVNSLKDADVYIITTKWKSAHFNFNFWEYPLFHGKAPPEGRFTEVTFSGQKVELGSVWRSSVNPNNC